MSTMHHVALSVDVARFTDAYIRKHYIHPGLRLSGAPITVESLRIASAEARAEGKRVFPLCDHTGPDGSCLGHEEAAS